MAVLDLQKSSEGSEGGPEQVQRGSRGRPGCRGVPGHPKQISYERLYFQASSRPQHKASRMYAAPITRPQDSLCLDFFRPSKKLRRK